MTKMISRRDFLKLGAATAGVLAVGQMLPPTVAQAAREAGHINAAGDGYVHSMCEMWGARLDCQSMDYCQTDGNPEHPPARHLCPG
jgi:anaerobic selenocysteine-containing dehydrogenase